LSESKQNFENINDINNNNNNNNNNNDKTLYESEFLDNNEKQVLSKHIYDVNLKLRRLVHESISDLIDPSRFFILFYVFFF
jgi:hypothetical protein